jgi:hypothetical protein
MKVKKDDSPGGTEIMTTCGLITVKGTHEVKNTVMILKIEGIRLSLVTTGVALRILIPSSNFHPIFPPEIISDTPPIVTLWDLLVK